MLFPLGWAQLRHTEIAFAFHRKLEDSSVIARGRSDFHGPPVSVLLEAETASCVLFTGQLGNLLCVTEYFECFDITVKEVFSVSKFYKWGFV